MADKQFTQTRPKLTRESLLSTQMDFIDLAEYCERLVTVLIEMDDFAERIALYKLLSLALEQLQAALIEPVPEYRLDQLTSNDETLYWNASFTAEPETLNEYCYALTQALLSHTLSGEVEEVLNGLLFELINFQVDDLKAPRFVQTDEGLEYIR